jgi:release factor glutamine methyltransferase
MNFKDLKQEFVKKVKDLYGVEDASILFFIILEHHKSWRKNEFHLNSLEVADVSLVSLFEEIAVELMNGKPVQYILGESWFFGFKFSVDSNVLIPRPETEELVEWAVAKLAERNGIDVLNTSIDVLDVGTGSGCIAITIKRKSPFTKVYAMDISSTALAVAKSNAFSNSAEVEFIQADILTYQSEKQYDLIVSNPPYVKVDEKGEMSNTVLDYEPHLALFVSNEDPLVFYKGIAVFGLTNLKTNGQLLMEINEYLGKEMIEMLERLGFIDVVLKKDMQGKDRMICCSKASGS